MAKILLCPSCHVRVVELHGTLTVDGKSENLYTYCPSCGLELCISQDKRGRFIVKKTGKTRKNA
jgi:hypothetical protein